MTWKFWLRGGVGGRMAAPMTLEPGQARLRPLTDPPSNPRAHRPLRRLWHEHDLGEELGVLPRRIAGLVAIALAIAIAATFV